MREEVGDLWTYPADARCITTNGVVKRDGCLVMGKGVALEAARLFPGLARMLGKRVKEYGNKPYPNWVGSFDLPLSCIVSFPTKRHWCDKSCIGLIVVSAKALVRMTDSWKWQTVVLPRPGCGNGGLLWTNVKKHIAPILDDRFVVLTPKE